MKQLTLIHDAETKDPTHLIKGIKPRVAARAVVLNGDSVAVLRVTRDGYHKLPGGGREGTETLTDTLRRELLEEIGCEVTNIQEIGQINDYRAKWKFYQESYCYLAHVKTKDLITNMTENELTAGLKLVWLPSVQEAIAIFEQDQPTTYEGGLYSGGTLPS